MPAAVGAEEGEVRVRASGGFWPSGDILAVVPPASCGCAGREILALASSPHAAWRGAALGKQPLPSRMAASRAVGVILRAPPPVCVCARARARVCVRARERERECVCARARVCGVDLD